MPHDGVPTYPVKKHAFPEHPLHEPHIEDVRDPQLAISFVHTLPEIQYPLTSQPAVAA